MHCTPQVKAICEELGTGFLGLGFDPKWAIKDIPVMPKDRLGRGGISLRQIGRGRPCPGLA